METQQIHQHRDTIFRGLFIEPQYFLQLLAHCTNGTATLTADQITPFLLESSVAPRLRRNDVSFITKDSRLIILVEHQSTLCANMALRILMYYMELLQLWIKTNDINLHGTKKIEDLPVPEFYVAYNGMKELNKPNSTFTINQVGVKIEIEVKIVDIHYENLSDTHTSNYLAGYSYFYKIYDERIQQGITSKKAFDQAREECIKHEHLKGFIEKEEFVMFYKDIFDYDVQLKAEGKAEGLEEGKAKGIEEGKAKGLEEGMAKGEASGLLKAATKLVKKGTDIQYVIETLSLSEAQVTQLKKLTA